MTETKPIEWKDERGVRRLMLCAEVVMNGYLCTVYATKDDLRAAGYLPAQPILDIIRHHATDPDRGTAADHRTDADVVAAIVERLQREAETAKSEVARLGSELAWQAFRGWQGHSDAEDRATAAEARATKLATALEAVREPLRIASVNALASYLREPLERVFTILDSPNPPAMKEPDGVPCAACGLLLEPEPKPMCDDCIAECGHRGIDEDPEELRKARSEGCPGKLTPTDSVPDAGAGAKVELTPEDMECMFGEEKPPTLDELINEYVAITAKLIPFGRDEFSKRLFGHPKMRELAKAGWTFDEWLCEHFNHLEREIKRLETRILNQRRALGGLEARDTLLREELTAERTKREEAERERDAAVAKADEERARRKLAEEASETWQRKLDESRAVGSGCESRATAAEAELEAARAVFREHGMSGTRLEECARIALCGWQGRSDAEERCRALPNPSAAKEPTNLVPLLRKLSCSICSNCRVVLQKPHTWEACARRLAEQRDEVAEELEAQAIAASRIAQEAERGGYYLDSIVEPTDSAPAAVTEPWDLSLLESIRDESWHMSGASLLRLCDRADAGEELNFREQCALAAGSRGLLLRLQKERAAVMSAPSDGFCRHGTDLHRGDCSICAAESARDAAVKRAEELEANGRAEDAGHIAMLQRRVADLEAREGPEMAWERGARLTRALCVEATQPFLQYPLQVALPDYVPPVA